MDTPGEEIAHKEENAGGSFNPVAAVARGALGVAVLMFCFEFLKEEFLPHLTHWGSHRLTIAVTTTLATFGALYVVRVQRRAFAAMQKRNRELTELRDSLTALNASLDVRVAERTKALSDANSLLKKEVVERQRIELELRLAQKLEALGRLAAGVAHEINTPVQFVSDNVHGNARHQQGNRKHVMGKGTIFTVRLPIAGKERAVAPVKSDRLAS